MIRLGPGSYFGETVSANRAGRFAITATKYEPGQVLPKHYHAQPYLFVMLRGGLGEVERQREHVCTRGWLVYNEAGESHHDVVLDDGALGLNIELPTRWLTEFRDARGKHEPIIYRHAGPALTAIGALELALRADSSIRAVAVEEAVTRLVDSLRLARDARGTTPRWLDRAESYIREHFRDSLCLSTIAGEAGVHPAHLCREFRRRFGCTMTQYAARLRSDDAFQQLTGSAQPLAAVAARAGFADQAHLTRTMREHFRTTPSRIRQTVAD
jgi:AraC family transcriptional regulator